MKQFVLLGDSVFDNAAYVEPHTAVLDHLNQSLPQGWSPLLKARDGAVIADVKNQELLFYIYKVYYFHLKLNTLQILLWELLQQYIFRLYQLYNPRYII